MTETIFHNRRVVQIENELIRVTVTVEGGHIAEILHKKSGLNPLWIPPWRSIEPSTHSAKSHPEYGNDPESKLLAGIMGHNLCLDLFGAPSEEEARAGITVHCEANIVAHEFFSAAPETLTARCVLPVAQLRFERTIFLQKNKALIIESVENLSSLDRPIAWTQHVTLGPPFLEKGVTQFRVPATKSRALGTEDDFDWPIYTRPDGAKEDLQVFTDAPSSGGFTTHLMDPGKEDAYFFAHSPASNILFGYVWKRENFPWLGIWEENHSRTHAPWNGKALTRGMEFGVSPFPESRRKMIDRHTMYGSPCYRWIPAKGRLHAEYFATISESPAIPETMSGIIAPL